ncbi:MAG: hypothetical protein GX923_05735 [Clostridia bacterium]|jgi:hypothetical protein|nr:hypothetical protein [Clostridia bacterium]
MLLDYSYEILFLLIPFIAVSGGVIIAMIAVIKDYQLRSLMVEKGIYPEVEKKERKPRGLRSGLSLTALGGVLVTGLSGLDNLVLSLTSQSILALGVAQLLFYILQGRPRRERSRSHIHNL